MVRPSGPNLADLIFYCRVAAEALKARNIPAQGKHAESVRRPGYDGDSVRVPRRLWSQSALPTGTKGAMELTYLLGIDIVGMPGIHYQWLTDYCMSLLLRRSKDKGFRTTVPGPSFYHNTSHINKYSVSLPQRKVNLSQCFRSFR